MSLSTVSENLTIAKQTRKVTHLVRHYGLDLGRVQVTVRVEIYTHTHTPTTVHS